MVNGRTALHVAVAYGQKDVVLMLLDKGADRNMKGGFYKGTPLHYAAGLNYGDPEMVQLLINGGADINPTNGIGMTPYDVAFEKFQQDNEPYGESKHRHAQVLSMLRENGGLSRTELP